MALEIGFARAPPSCSTLRPPSSWLLGRVCSCRLTDRMT
jgi:hypothetical protein